MGYTKEQRESKKLAEVNIDESDISDIENETNTNETKTEIKPVKKLRNQLPKDMDVIVKSGFNGVLVYKNPKTGYTVEFSELGSEQELTIEDLKLTKNSNPIYFKKGWFIIEDQDVIYDLTLEQYFKFVLSKEEIEVMFTCDLDVFEEKFKNLNEGQKQSILYAAIECIDNGSLDSIKKIEFLESEFNVELIER